MKRDSSSPAAYVRSVESPQKKILETVRRVIRAKHPKVREGIRYGMLDYPGLANLAAQKNYVALYVAPEVLEQHKGAFPGVSAGKSCLRFKKPEEVDEAALEKLLRDVAKHRARTEG